MTKEIKWYIRYFKYVIKHKRFVWKQCFNMWLYRQGIIHDWSKFLPSEAIRYMRWFSMWDESVKEEFDQARLKHIHRNPHHWQYRILREDNWSTKALEMPEKYVKEMLCDRRWVGRAFSKDWFSTNNWWEVKEWYWKNKDNMTLHDDARDYIDLFLNDRPSL